MIPGTSGWQVQGTAAQNYEQYLVPAIFAAWVPRLLDAAGVGPGHRVLDVACGTGIVARGAAGRVTASGRVVGLDLNAEMLEAARATGAESVDWRSGDAGDLPFDAGEFDAVICQQGLQFVPDAVQAAREMGRVAGDGTVVVAVWGSLEANPVFASFAEALGHHAGPEAAAIMRSPFTMGDTEALREIFDRAGFGRVTVEVEEGAAFFDSAAALVSEEAASSPLAEPLSALDTQGWVALEADVEKIVADYGDDDGIRFPMTNQIVTARA